MLERLTGLNYSGNTTNISGTDTYNYSVDALKKAAFVDEINNVLKVKNSVDLVPILDYLNNRVKEIDKRYK